MSWQQVKERRTETGNHEPVTSSPTKMNIALEAFLELMTVWEKTALKSVIQLVELGYGHTRMYVGFNQLTISYEVVPDSTQMGIQ